MKKTDWAMLVTIICLSLFVFSGQAEKMNKRNFDNLVKAEIAKTWAK